MNAQQLQRRTLDFARRALALVDSLPHTAAGRLIGDQMLRSATSVGANYRAACRARSVREFVAKLGIALEEADETVYWLELIVAARMMTEERLTPLRDEANAIVAILVASINTSKRRAGTKSAS